MKTMSSKKSMPSHSGATSIKTTRRDIKTPAKTPKELAALERILKIFGNRRRLAILQYLARTGKASVGDIAEEINLSFKATSKHLSILSHLDLLEREQINLSMFYSISDTLPSLHKHLIDLL